MITFIIDCGFQILTALKNLFAYFKSSPISSGFFLFLFIVAVVNVFKTILIFLEKKTGFPDRPCIHLSSGRHGSECTEPAYEQGFRDRNNSCEGCTGKILSITNEEAANRTAASATWKCNVILLANYSKGILPYVSFLYTLFIAIFEKKN